MAVGVVFGVLRLADPGSDASSDGAAQGRSDAPTATAEEPGARAVGPYFDDNLTAGQADLLEYLAPHGYPLRYDGPATFDPSGDPEEAAAQVALLIMVAENTGFSEEDQAALSFPYTYDPSRPNFIAPNTDDDGDIKPPKDVVLTRLSDGGARLTFVFEAFYANKDQRDAVVNLIEGHFGGGPGQGVVEIAVDVEFDAAGRLAGGTSWRGIN